MDLTWVVWFLVWVLVAVAAYLIIAKLIMPAVPAGAQPFVWAVLGIVILIALITFFAGGHFGRLNIH
jgi:steroid 5-alpha reductase family enzyme